MLKKSKRPQFDYKVTVSMQDDCEDLSAEDIGKVINVLLRKAHLLDVHKIEVGLI